MANTIIDSNGNVWQSWISDTSTWHQGTTSGTSMSAQVWMNWTATAATTAYNTAIAPTAPPNREQVRAYEERKKAQAAKLAVAAARAATLLQTVLDDQQKEELKTKGYFHVHTRKGKRVYRLKPGSNPILIKGESGKQYSYCIHPRESFPRDDSVAALKLLLDADEEAFLKTANATPVLRAVAA